LNPTLPKFAIILILFLVFSSVGYLSNVSGDESVLDRQILYVGGTGVGNYSSIQKAIDNASTGDTVFVFNGTYGEDIDINKRIELVGENRNTSKVDGTLNIYYKDVKISNLTFFDSDPNDPYEREVNIFNDSIVFEDNNLFDCFLYVLHSYNSTISNNRIENTSYGIWLRSSSFCNVNDNTMLNCRYGLSIQNDYSYYGWYNRLRNNTMIDCGIRLYGNKLNHFIQDIDVSNTVDGKPIYYVYNESSVSIPSNAGDVILVDCLNISVNSTPCRSITLAYSFFTMVENNSCSVRMFFSDYNIVRNNALSECSLKYSDHNQIVNNTCNNFYVDYGDYNLFKNNNINSVEAANGMAFYTSSHNQICDNTITSDYGITIGLDSLNNTIHRNLISNCYNGMRMSSANNLIYHNIFRNNSIHARDYSINYWYNQPLLEGNYWDNYTGVDENGDGIGDMPFNISEGDNQDLYPLIHPYGLITNLSPGWSLFGLPMNLTVFISDITIFHNYTFLTWQEAIDQGIILVPLFPWNTSTQQYDINDDVIIPGTGQWMYAMEDCELWTFNYERNYDTLLTSVEPQWNMVSTPFDYPIFLDDVLVYSNGSSYNWTEAVSNSIIDGNTFGWDSTTQSYVIASQFEPGEAYWMYAYYPCILK
jgi:parallel beta-helix repeat protein